jgi:hypothetical protein
MSEKGRLFIHCGFFETRHLSIMKEFLDAIESSKVSDEVDVIVCTVGGGGCSQPWYDEKLNCEEFQVGEFHTLGVLKDFANKSQTNVPVGYIHTKGLVNGWDNPCISDWRKYMTYFIVERMKDCNEYVMGGFDAVGVDWSELPNRHFSGNFWWSNTDYVKSLPNINPPNFQIENCPSHRHLAEFWIGANNPKVKCLHQSGIGIYERHLHRYEREKYNV